MKTYQELSKYLILVSLSLLATSNLTAQDVFVSPQGSDNNTGLSSASSVASFQKAADVAKSMAASTVIVQFASGTYVFNNTVVLDKSYNGITFQAEPGGTVIFSSLKQVTGWTEYNQNIMMANSPLAPGTIVRYLQDSNENWMSRSATHSFRAAESTENPEDSYHDPLAQDHKLNVQHPSGLNSNIDWAKANQYDLRAAQSGWNMEILPIASYDAGQSRIHTKIPAMYEMRTHETESIWPSINQVINTIAGIDEPGEWAIIDDIIYLMPKMGIENIFVPRLIELIRIDSDLGGNGNTWSGDPVTDINFKGITFTGGDFYVFENNDIASTHDWEVVDKPSGLLGIRNASNITIDNCVFTKSGGSGLRLDRYAQNISITNSTFTYLGRSGISLIGRGPGYGDVNRDNVIIGNVIKSIGREKWTSPAIILDQSSNNILKQNYIEDTYFSAIVITGPKQFIFMNNRWGTFDGNTWKGRDFHSRAFKPDVYNTIPLMPVSDFDIGTWNAMSHLYSGNNTIDNNIFINTSSGQGYLVQSSIYISGITRSQSNFIQYNYFHETKEASTNSSVIWSDSDQDNVDYIGNMVNGLDLGDNEPEGVPVFRANVHCIGAEDATLHDDGDRGLLRANVTINSTSSKNISFDIEDFTIQEGNIVDSNGGSSDFLDLYIKMYLAICDENFPKVESLPGVLDMRNKLSAKILEFGGIVPQCDGNSSNNPPVVSNAIPDQSTQVGEAFEFTFADNTFTDIDKNDVLSYSVKLADESELPNWLTFNSSSRTFKGTPTNVGTLDIQVTAKDSFGASIEDNFELVVNQILSIKEGHTNAVTVYPNPVESSFVLRIENDYKGQLKFELSDISGKVLTDKQLLKRNRTERFYLDPKLHEGIYLIKISFLDQIITKTVLKK